MNLTKRKMVRNLIGGAITCAEVFENDDTWIW